MASPASRIQLLRKLWGHLTPKEMFGIMSPDRIQKMGLSLGEVRRQELSNIHTIERQLNDIRRGYLELDQEGRLVKTSGAADVRDIAFSSIIEFTANSPGVSDRSPDIAEMLANSCHMADLEALGRFLRLQKVYLLTERIILGSNPPELDKNTLDPRWFSRWRISVSEIPNGPMQQMWARILVHELIRPGSHSMRALDALSSLTLEDAEQLNRLSAITFGDFIYRSALQVSDDSGMLPTLEGLEELGMLKGVTGKVCARVLQSMDGPGFHCELKLGDHCLQVRSALARNELSVPAYLLTRLGREVISLFSAIPDEAYLQRVISDLQARGMEVTRSGIETTENGRKVS